MSKYTAAAIEAVLLVGSVAAYGVAVLGAV